MTVQRVQVARRFSDTNLAGHVDNSVFLDYWQEARVAVFAELYTTGWPSWLPVVVRHELDLSAEIRWSREPLDVDVWVAAIGNTSFTMAGRIFDEHGTQCASVRTVIVGIDPVTRKPTAMPSEVRSALAATLVEVPA